MIKAADTAIADQKLQISIRDLRVKQDEDQIQVVQKENADLRSAESAWYRSPTFWLVLGALTGGYIARH